MPLGQPTARAGNRRARELQSGAERPGGERRADLQRSHHWAAGLPLDCPPLRGRGFVGPAGKEEATSGRWARKWLKIRKSEWVNLLVQCVFDFFFLVFGAVAHRKGSCAIILNWWNSFFQALSLLWIDLFAPLVASVSRSGQSFFFGLPLSVSGQWIGLV